MPAGIWVIAGIIFKFSGPVFPLTFLVFFKMEAITMANIKDTTSIADKWTRVTPSRAEEYKAGVTTPRTDWKAAAVAAAARWKEAIQAAAARDAFSKGVGKTNSGVWQERAATIGASRWPEGVATSGARYAQGFQPYADTIKGTALPARYPKGDPRNFDRVKAIATALRAKKTSIG